MFQAKGITVDSLARMGLGDERRTDPFLRHDIAIKIVMLTLWLQTVHVAIDVDSLPGTRAPFLWLIDFFFLL